MIKIKRAELRGKDVGQIFHFPEFTSDILHLANQKSHGTTKKMVGKTLELIADFDGKTYEEWSSFYEERRPGSIDHVVDLIQGQVAKFKTALEAIDRDLIHAWVEENVLKSTYAAARLNEVILKRLALLQGKAFHHSRRRGPRGQRGWIHRRSPLHGQAHRPLLQGAAR